MNTRIKSLVDNKLETGGIEARKTGNIRPTKAGLSDCKSTGNDVTLLFGITNPFSFEYPSYLGYDINKVRDNFRVMEVVLNRHGKSNGLCPLFFDGAVNYFKVMPLPNDNMGLNIIYDHIQSISRKSVNKAYTFLSFNKKANSINPSDDRITYKKNSCKNCASKVLNFIRKTKIWKINLNGFFR